LVKLLANGIVTSLRQHPSTLALVVLNVAFLIAFAFMFREIANSAERRDAVIVQLLQQCGK
jgi:hypothetical protein